MLRAGESETNLLYFSHITFRISVISLTIACEHSGSRIKVRIGRALARTERTHDTDNFNCPQAA